MRTSYQILPFYTDLNNQYHRRYRAYDTAKAPLLAPGGLLPSFQVQVPIGYNQLTFTVTAVNVITGADIIITNDIRGGLNSLFVGTFADRNYELLIFISDTPVGLPLGTYYLRIQFSNGVTYFSELITVCHNTGQIRLTWWNDDNMEIGDMHIDYKSAFRNCMFLDTEFGKPNYPYEDTVHRRDGVDFIEKIISSKVYRCEAIMGEPTLDGVRLIRLHSDIFVSSGGVSKRVNDLVMSVEWDEVGFYGIVTFDLHTDTIVKQIGKGRIIV